MVSLKEINDFENDLKNAVRELELYDIETKKGFIKNKVKLSKDFWNGLILIGFNVIFLSKISIVIIIIGIIYEIVTYLKSINLSFNMSVYTESYKFNQNVLDGKIDSCELLKKYIRGNKLSKEELAKIITYLYFTFPNELNEIVQQAEEIFEEKIEIYKHKNVETVQETTIQEFSTPSMYIDNTPIKRTLKR